MSRFRNLPIRRKLTIIAMLSSFLALLLACLAFVTYELVTFRASMVGDLSSTARMIGDNSTAALSFNDPASAEQTLKSLGAHAHIVGGTVYDKDGNLFASYQRAGLAGSFIPPPVEPEGHRFGDNRLELFHRIELVGETVGVVYIQSDLGVMRDRLWRYSLIVVAVMLTATLLAFMLTTRMQRVISEPISHLAGIVGTVATSRDYSVRATKQSEDELGTLIDGFNAMLEQIQVRDAELQNSRNLLEQRVEERTEELRREVAERRQAEQQSLRAQAFLNSVLDNLPVGVFLKCADDRRIVLWNKANEDIHGISAGEIVGKNDSDLFSKADADYFFAKDTEVLEQGGIVEIPVETIQTRHRGARMLHTHKLPLFGPDGMPEYLLGISEDITERKRAEAELENARNELLAVSRQAGMAEVATGVLHNVGNVLNSVNVSATLMGDRLKQSRTAGFAKVAALINEQAGDLPGFFARDARAAQLPGYLEQFAGYLAGEQAALLGEVEGLRKNIEHIKDIVAMQQSYAKVSGLTETLLPAELMADALRLNANSMDRHAIEVIQELEELPPLAVDKHKVLQILVNFLRNAKHACDDSGRVDKRITLRLLRRNGCVQFSVADNGVGIPAENLSRIFNHGFTTRKDGHGFGLHSGANAAREMGGRVAVHSAGPGRGATFTLELPVVQKVITQTIYAESPTAC